MDVPFRPYGLMRCCQRTLIDLYDRVTDDETTTVSVVEGATLKCQLCSSAITFREGAWERDKSAKSKYGDVPIPPEAEPA